MIFDDGCLKPSKHATLCGGYGSILHWARTVNEHFSELELAPSCCIRPKPGRLHGRWKDVLMVSIHVSCTKPSMFRGSYTWQIRSCTEWYHLLWTSYANGTFHLLATATDVKISLSNIWSCGRAKLAKCAADKATTSHTSNNCCVILAVQLSTNFNRRWWTERSGQKCRTWTLNDCKVFNNGLDHSVAR